MSKAHQPNFSMEIAVILGKKMDPETLLGIHVQTNVILKQR